MNALHNIMTKDSVREAVDRIISEEASFLDWLRELTDPNEPSEETESAACDYAAQVENLILLYDVVPMDLTIDEWHTVIYRS